MKEISDEFDGSIDLSIKALKNRSITDKFLFSGQSRISARMNLNNEDTLCYFLITMGGGITEGKKYLTKIHLGPQSRALISSQVPTYIYKWDNGKISQQFFDIRIEKDAILEYLPDNVIPYANSRYNQLSRIKIEKNASLIYSDGITAGWSPDGKDFKYDYVHMNTEIVYDNHLMYTDNMILNPHKFNLKELGLYENYRNFSSLIAINEKIDENFVKKMQKEVQKDPHCNFGISKLEGPGLVARILGENITDNEQKMMEIVDYLRNKFLDSPKLELRKNIAKMA